MRILVFGDSIAQGFWDSDGGWVNRLRRQYDLMKIEGGHEDPPTIFNLGISSNSSEDVVHRMEHEIIARQLPGEELCVVIAIGVNDSRLENNKPYCSEQQYRDNLEQIYKIAANMQRKS